MERDSLIVQEELREAESGLHENQIVQALCRLDVLVGSWIKLGNTKNASARDAWYKRTKFIGTFGIKI